MKGWNLPKMGNEFRCSNGQLQRFRQWQYLVSLTDNVECSVEDWDKNVAPISHHHHSQNTFNVHETLICYTVNVRLHGSKQSTQTSTSLRYTVLQNPPYYPYSAPTDYGLFSKMQEPLRGRKFPTTGDPERGCPRYCGSMPIDLKTCMLLLSGSYQIDGKGE
jgi:hypothetical protein